MADVKDPSDESDQVTHPNSDQSAPDPSPNALIPTEIYDIPDEVLAVIFSYVRLIDIRNAKLACKDWNFLIGDEIWRIQCLKRMRPEVLCSQLLSSCPSYYAKLRAFEHAWNPMDSSINMYVKPDGFTVQRDDGYMIPGGCRAKLGFSEGRHAWEITWTGSLEEHSVIGIATLLANMRGDERHWSLVGNDSQSWGWNLYNNQLSHNPNYRDPLPRYPAAEAGNDDDVRYQPGEKIKVILDCGEGTLSFEKNSKSLGVAFRELPEGAELYPVVSAFQGEPEISMVYLGPL